MSETIHKIISILNEWNFKYNILKSHKDTIILFYNPVSEKSIIYGISRDVNSSSIDIGNLVIYDNNPILGYSHRLSDFSDFNADFKFVIEEISKTIENDELMEYLDEKMKSQHKFFKAKDIINRFAQTNRYKKIEMRSLNDII